MINKVVLIGRLTKDPEIKRTSSDLTVASFTLAVDRTFKSKDGEKEADFIPIVVWRKTAELCEKYLHKGDMCGAVGRIQTRTYDAQDGSKRYVTEVVADEVQFMSAKKNENNNYSSNDLTGFEEITDLGVPF